MSTRRGRPNSATDLNAIVRHYQVYYRSCKRRELDWFRTGQPTLITAVETAANASDHRRKRYRHQTRIHRTAIDAAQECLLNQQHQIERCKRRGFHDLWELFTVALGPIGGLGELYIYDTSLRIGAHVGLEPDRVYLHAGTRTGARNLGLILPRSALKWLLPSHLPPELAGLPPYEVEDILCIYKDRFVRSACDHSPRQKSTGRIALRRWKGGCAGSLNNLGCGSVDEFVEAIRGR